MNKKLILSGAAVFLGLVLFAAVFAAGEQLPQGGVGLCAGLGGALIGLGGGSLFLPLTLYALSPEDRREAERSDRDERSIAIRTHAAQDSWYWTLVLLWVPFAAALVREEAFWTTLCCAVLVLHCGFYLLHVYRWTQKL